MESTQSRTRSRKPRSTTKRGLIVEAWNRLERPAIGEHELREIQGSVLSQLGEGAVESPAAIARVLADEGAELRHPEVIEFDARWREAKIERESEELKDLDDLLTARPLRLVKAEELIGELEKLRQSSEGSGSQLVRSMAVSARQAAELHSKDWKLSQLERAEQAEIVEWFKVWIQTPSLFADWLDLRRRSVEFQKKYSTSGVAP